MGQAIQYRRWISRTMQSMAGSALMLVVVLMLAVASTQSALCRTFTVLANFSDLVPATTLVQDAKGNLYGTTLIGGGHTAGSVFKLDTRRNVTVLYAFTGGNDGAYPNPELALDSEGNLYGTTNQGGTNSNGLIFKLDKAGHKSVLYNFCSQQLCADGRGPRAGVIRDANGNLYGTTLVGGKGGGVVYRLDSRGKYTVLHTFSGAEDGLGPFSVLALDQAGNLYGTTPEGGKISHGPCQFLPHCGVVFKVDPSGRETVLHAFEWGSDGVGPFAGVTVDSAGNLYGTTFIGGNHGCAPPPISGRGCGTVYKVDKTGKETVLYRWHGSAEFDPFAGVVRDKQGNLYGATKYGGNLSCGGGTGCGTIFKLDPSGKLTVLHTFTGGSDGSVPNNTLLLDGHGNLYGTTVGGNNATLFKITP